MRWNPTNYLDYALTDNIYLQRNRVIGGMQKHDAHVMI